MPSRVLAKRLDFYDPSTGALKLSLSNDVKRIEIREIARDEADDAGFDIANLNAAHTGAFSVGDEVRVFIRTESDASLNQIWTGVVDSLDYQRTGYTFADLPVKAQDYVFWRLAHAYVTDSYTNMTVGAIVRSILATYVVGVDGTAFVEDTATTLTQISFNGISALECIRKLADLGGAEWRGDMNKALHFFAKKTKSSGLSVSPADVVAGTFHMETSMAGFGNVQKVRGGNKALIDTTNGEGFGSWMTLTGSTRRTQKVFVTKSRFVQVDLWTDPTGFTGALRLRIQAANAAGTGPVDATDDTKDIINHTLAAAFLQVGGWTTFLLAPHVLPPGGSAWLIVDCPDATSSQRVGLDLTGPDLMYQTYYPVPIVAERTDAASIAQYGRRELPPLVDSLLQTDTQAALAGDMELAQHSTPARQGSYEVATMTLSAANVGETLTASFPNDGVANGTALIVMEKDHTFDAEKGTYSLVHQVADAERILRMEDIILSLQEKIQRVEDAVLGNAKDTLVDLVRSASDTLRHLDATAVSTQTYRSFKVGPGRATVGYSTIT